MERAETGISVEVLEGVTYLRIDGPQRLNALSTACIRTLAAELEAAQESSAVVITGVGRAFCTGADLGTAVTAETVDAAGELVELIAAVPPPVIAAVNGPAAGVGASIALSCDLVLAAESAFFLLPFLPLGLVPDGGATHSVVAGAGRARAARMAFGGERIPAALAAEWGLVSEGVPDGDLDAKVSELLDRICSAPREAAVQTKKLLRAADRQDLAKAVQGELEVQAKLLGSTEYALARDGFLARKPVDFRAVRAVGGAV
ncbi:MAG: enoyl-CoA hydratase-related protein [Arthrobacter sp.]